MKAAVIVSSAALLLAGASGFLASKAISGSAQATRTVTVNVGTGQQGPAGPRGEPGPRGERGPTGPAGAGSCPPGFELGDLVINHPGGQVTLFTCLKLP